MAVFRNDFLKFWHNLYIFSHRLFFRACRDGAIVDMDSKDDNSRSHPGIENSMVVVSMLEAQLDEHLVEHLVPGMAGLLESIDCFSKLGDKMMRIEPFKIGWELHEDLLIEISI